MTRQGPRRLKQPQPPTLRSSLGGVIKEMRINRGLTQTEAAYKGNMSQSMWARAELGKTTLPLDSLNAFSLVLGVRIAQLINEAERKFHGGGR